MKRSPRLVVWALFLLLAACVGDGPRGGGNVGKGGTAAFGKGGSGGNAGNGNGAAGSGGSAGTGGTGNGQTMTGGMGGSSGSGGGVSDPGGNGGAASTGSGADSAPGTSRGAGGAASDRGGGTAGASLTGGTTTAGGSASTGGSNAAGGTSASGGTSGTGGDSGPSCTTCHGDSATNNPAPPTDASGNTQTSAAGVGAHAKHLATSTWHRQGRCTDCHPVPASTAHVNGTVDFTWGSPSNADNAKPTVGTTDPDAPTCSGVYCHGTTLAGASSAKTTPVWNQVDGSWNACGLACHATPPPASTGHPTSTACQTCHSKVIVAFQASTRSTTWQDPSLHVNGTVEADSLTCTSCHGSGNNPAPPKDTQGNTATTAAGVGAHAQHLASSSWHRQGQCTDCHTLPTSNTHANSRVDFTWGAPSTADGATPSYSSNSLSCGGTYCHGARMTDTSSSVGHVPVWNKVDGTHDACGRSCHANPPKSGSHSTSDTACQKCHGDVIASYNGASSTWKNAALHVNGKVEATLDCSSCHGNPPSGGEHRRREHRVACTYCHPDPNGSTHRNGTVNVTCGSSRNGCHDGD